MANYFSIGQCAKVGYNFERNRTNTKCCNDMAYVCSGMKYIFCSCICYPPLENIPLKEMIEFGGSLAQPESRDSISEEPKLLNPYKDNVDKVMFATDKTHKTDFYLKGDPISLVATNVPSFMGGKAKPWTEATQEMMVERHDDPNITIESYGDTLNQSYYDGVLEFSAAASMI